MVPILEIRFLQETAFDCKKAFKVTVIEKKKRNPVEVQASKASLSVQQSV